MIILAIEPLASSQQQNKKRRKEKRRKEKRRKEKRRKEKRRKGIRGTEDIEKDNDYASDSQQSCDTVIISRDEPERDDTIELPNEDDTIEFPPLVRTHAIRRVNKDE